MVKLLRILSTMFLLGFAFMVKIMDAPNSAWVESVDSAPGIVESWTKNTASLLDYVDEDVKKTLLEEDIVAFELGLCWEDGYHRHRTEDAELIDQITDKVRSLEIRLDSVSDQAACDAGTELIFVTKDGRMQVIQLNEWRFEIRKDNSYMFYELANDDGLWELCQEVYIHGTEVDY